MSATIANKLSHDFKDKEIVIVVAFTKGARVNLSIRGEKVREKVLDILKDFSMSTGGGHENAVGAQIDLDQVEEFKKRMETSFQ